MACDQCAERLAYKERGREKKKLLSQERMDKGVAGLFYEGQLLGSVREKRGRTGKVSFTLEEEGNRRPTIKKKNHENEEKRRKNTSCSSWREKRTAFSQITGGCELKEWEPEERLQKPTQGEGRERSTCCGASEDAKEDARREVSGLSVRPER